MGKSGAQACPAVGTALRDSLLQMAHALEDDPQSVGETEGRVERELDRWGHGASEYFKQRATEVKELMLIMARTAEVMGERDQRYSQRFQEFTGRLQSMARLEDLVEIKDSLVRSAIDLQACAEAMAEESRKSVAQLHDDVTVYRARLDDAEKLAGLDPLTGLNNRRRIESSIDLKMSQKRPFSVLMLDLNEFKRINDTYGHPVGDEVLKQFAAELKQAFRAGGVVGRWGGDEFVVVVDGNLEEAKSSLRRVAEWVFGDYTVSAGGKTLKLPVHAAGGVAMCQSGDSVRSLVDRADAAMYRDKRAAAQAAKQHRVR